MQKEKQTKNKQKRIDFSSHLKAGDVGAKERRKTAGRARALALVAELVVEHVGLHLHLNVSRDNPEKTNEYQTIISNSRVAVVGLGVSPFISFRFDTAEDSSEPLAAIPAKDSQDSPEHDPRLPRFGTPKNDPKSLFVCLFFSFKSDLVGFTCRGFFFANHFSI